MIDFNKYHESVAMLCKQYKVKTLYVFGSALTENFGKESDVDFIVDFESLPITDYVNNYFDFKFSLEDIFKRPVDLLEEKSLRNPYFIQSINKHKRLVYGA